MRLSVGDINAHKYNAYCDGEFLNRCIMADEEQGLAVCYARDENGKHIFTDETKQELETVEVKGKIELRLREADPNE